jgi:hypothetical protein
MWSLIPSGLSFTSSFPIVPGKSAEAILTEASETPEVIKIMETDRIITEILNNVRHDEAVTKTSVLRTVRLAWDDFDMRNIFDMSARNSRYP